MKCQYCNQKIKKTDTYCPHCGRLLEEEMISSRVAKNKQAKVKKQKRYKRIILILCMVGVVGITVLGVQAFLSQHQKEEVEEDKIVLKQNFYQINVDESAQIEVEGNDLTFVSQNRQVVEVDSEGVITGKKLGKTIIHISNQNGDIASCSVNVIDDEIGQTVEESVIEEIEETHDEDYIIPDSDVRILKEDDLKLLSQEQLSLARNEIFARKGRKFKTEAIQSYFESKSWYKGTIEADKFNNDMLSEIERKNVEFISAYEKIIY